MTAPTRRSVIRRAAAWGLLPALAPAAALAPRAALAEPGARPKAGAPAPAFAATDIAGAPVSLDGLRGRVVVLEWTNHLCPYTVKHYRSGNMQALQRDAAAAGVAWISVISSGPGRAGFVSPERAAALSAERGATPAHVVRDPTGAFARLYEARVTPQMVVIDAAGVLAYKGAIDSTPSATIADIATSRNYVRDALAALAAGRRPDPAVTRPYGCAIRYAA